MISTGRLILGAILGLFTVVHLLFAIDRDAGAFLTVGQGILDGRIPYRDFFDHKPPGIYYMLALVLAVSKGSIWGAKVFLLLIAYVVLALIARILRKVGEDTRTLWWGVCLGALGWVIYQGYTLVTETLVALFVTASIASLLRPRPRWHLAGSLIGLAVLFKQPAVLLVIPLLLYGLLTHSRVAFWKALGGFFGILAASVFVALISGIASPAFQQIVWVNVNYAAKIEIREVVKGNFALYFSAAPLWSAAFLPVVTRSRDPRTQFLTGMLVATWLPALLHPTPHYLLPAVPVGAMLAARGAREVEQRLTYPLSVAPVLFLVVPLVFHLIFATLAAFSHLTLLKQIEAGDALAEMTDASEPILVIGAEPQYYFLAHRYPPGEDIYLLEVNYREEKEKGLINYIRSGLVRTVAIADTPPTLLYASRVRAYVEQHCSLRREWPVIHLAIWTCAAIP